MTESGADRYDIIFVGSGFSSIFFLHKVLSLDAAARVLVLERGEHNSWQWQVDNSANVTHEFSPDRLLDLEGMPGKTWPHNVGVGGGSNCWWANAMRFHPTDFELRKQYGAGIDWPYGYDALEPYYAEAEDIMAISGDDESHALFPRSHPFPQPRHRFSRVARAFKDRYPDQFFAMPQARARVATDIRNPCCSNSDCSLCPVNAKFMIIQDLKWIFDDSRVTVRPRSEVKQLITDSNTVQGVSYTTDDDDRKAFADMVVLGANGIYNPFLLLKSGIDHGPVGRGLTEQIPITVDVDLDGLEDGDGSAHVTGVGYNFLHGEHRKSAAGGFYQINNLPLHRAHATKWRQTVTLDFLLSDLRDERNYVGISPENPDKPLVHFEGWTSYAYAGLDHVRDNLEALLSHLPVENIKATYGGAGGHAHFEGTTVMGADADTSVVDSDLLHHRLRNLVVLGSGAFPNAGAVNPTLTLSAMALRSAERLFAH